MARSQIYSRIIANKGIFFTRVYQMGEYRALCIDRTGYGHIYVLDGNLDSLVDATSFALTDQACEVSDYELHRQYVVASDYSGKLVLKDLRTLDKVRSIFTASSEDRSTDIQWHCDGIRPVFPVGP